MSARHPLGAPVPARPLPAADRSSRQDRIQLTDIYVDAAAAPGGSGSPDRPLRSLAEAVALLVQPAGVTLHLKGRFSEALILQNKHGKAMAPLRIQPWVQNGIPNQVILQGPAPVGESQLWPVLLPPSVTGPMVGVVLDNCSHILIDGLDIVPQPNFIVHGWPKFGLWTRNSSHLCIVRLKVAWTGGSAMAFSASPQINLGTRRAVLQIPPATNQDLVVHNCRIDQSNLGWWQKPPSGPESEPFHVTEALTIENYDGFTLTNNHISNVAKEGIDFKYQSRNGTVAYNLVEMVRSASIYANEGMCTFIYHNVVRYGGYYTVVQAGQAVRVQQFDQVQFNRYRWRQGSGDAISISLGDLACTYEMGITGALWIVANDLYWMWGSGINVVSFWRRQCDNPGTYPRCPTNCPPPPEPCTQPPLPDCGSPERGGIMEDIHILHNTIYKCLQRTQSPNWGAIYVDVTMQDSEVKNNIIAESFDNGYGIVVTPANQSGSHIAMGYNVFFSQNPGQAISKATLGPVQSQSSDLFCDPGFAVPAPPSPQQCSPAPCPLSAANFQLTECCVRDNGQHVVPLGPGYQAPPDRGAHDSDVIAFAGDWGAEVGNLPSNRSPAQPASP